MARQFFSRRSPVLARQGMVATSQPLAAMAGLRVLLQGAPLTVRRQGLIQARCAARRFQGPNLSVRSEREELLGMAAEGDPRPRAHRSCELGDTGCRTVAIHVSTLDHAEKLVVVLPKRDPVLCPGRTASGQKDQGSRCQPKIQMPRKTDSRKKASRASMARGTPKMSPTKREYSDQFMPNWNS